jgi:hypothetical protein
MVNKYLISIFCCGTLLFSTQSYAKATFSEKICKKSGYSCLTVAQGQSWGSLFENDGQRNLVKRLNRNNTALSPGDIIAVPEHLSRLNLMDISPFPQKIAPQDYKQLKVNQSQFAWGAYNKKGELVKWGPMSGGANYCSDKNRHCGTVTGEFKFHRRQGAACVSGKYPLPTGGAPMPYCMHFYKGYALHGSKVVPGYHASKGCVRVFLDDAKWLNQDFVKLHDTRIEVTK